MRSIRASLFFVLALLIPGVAFGQTYTSVTATHVQSLTGTLLATGSLCFQGTDSNNNPIGFQAGGSGGAIITTPQCTPVVNGVISGFQVANPANTSPTNIRYHITIVQGSKKIDDFPNAYLCAQSGACTTPYVFSFDTCLSSGACANNPLPIPSGPGGGGGGGTFSLTGSFSVNDCMKILSSTTGASSGAGCGGGGGSSAWSALSPGTNTTAGEYLNNQPGTFTNAAQNDYLVSILNGGDANCNPLNFINAGGSTYKLTNAVTGLACTPIGTTGVTNAYTTGGWFGAKASNSGAFGQFGGTYAVGVNAAGWCNANNTSCWGLNGGAFDNASQTGNHVNGVEMDMTVNNSSSQGFAYYTQFRGNGQPTGDTMPAFWLDTPAGTGAYTSGFKCGDGSVWAGGNQICLGLGQLVAGSSASNSQIVSFFARNNSARTQQYFQLSKQDVMIWGGLPVALINAGTESYGIGMTATAGLTANLLVKLDTAADAIVLCTPSDVTCLGFVQSNENPTGLCTIGATYCPIATIPGSKVSGILGTGTCSIKDYVVIDTTTNGRVKCQATIPTATEWIGTATSAQAAVGSLLDIITKFQTCTTCTVQSGSTALNSGSAIAGSGGCSTTVTQAATGVATTDRIEVDYNTDPTAVTGYAPTATGSLKIYKWPTVNAVNFKQCNETSGAITPSPMTLNWGVIR